MATTPVTDDLADPVRVEPTAGLQWSQAMQLTTPATEASYPAAARKALIHKAPEDEVLRLYREACGGTGEAPAADVPAPWWLRGLALGVLDSRESAFRIEDRIAQLLLPRPGWEYVPWTMDGESGFWEYVPSERAASDFAVPTTLLLTERHPGWIDVLPAHTGPTPEPLAVNGPANLRSRLGAIEAVR